MIFLPTARRGRGEARLMLQQPLLVREAAPEPGEGAIGADDAVTGHHNRDGVRPVSRTNGAAGPRAAELGREMPIAQRRAGRNRS